MGVVGCIEKKTGGFVELVRGSDQGSSNLVYVYFIQIPVEVESSS